MIPTLAERLVDRLTEEARGPREAVEEGLAAGPDMFAHALVSLEQTQPERVRALIEALGACRSQAAAAALLAYRDRTRVKRLRKAAGHALALLASAGIDVTALQATRQPEPPPEASSEPATGPKRDEQGWGPELLPDGVAAKPDRARLMAAVPYRTRSFRQQRISPDQHALVNLYDGDGHRLLLLPCVAPRQPFGVVWAELDGSGELDTVFRADLSKNEFASWHNRTGDPAFERFFAIPIEYGRFLFHRAVERRRASGRPDPDWGGVEPGRVPAAPRFTRPLIFWVAPELVEGASQQIDERLRSSPSMDTELLIPWVPYDGVQPEWDVARALIEGRLELSSDSDEWIRELELRAVNRLYGGSGARELYAERFYELAYRLWADGRDEQAAMAVAVGLALEEPGRPVTEIPFLRGLVGLALAIHVAAYTRKRGEDLASLVDELEDEPEDAGEDVNLADEEEQEGSGEETTGQAAFTRLGRFGLRRLNWRRVFPNWQENRHHLLTPRGVTSGAPAPASAGERSADKAAKGEGEPPAAPLSPGWERRGRLIVPRQVGR